MPGIFVRLTREPFERLRRLALRERRRPQDQAAVLVERALDAVESGPTRRDRDDPDVVGEER